MIEIFLNNRLPKSQIDELFKLNSIDEILNMILSDVESFNMRLSANSSILPDFKSESKDVLHSLIS